MGFSCIYIYDATAVEFLGLSPRPASPAGIDMRTENKYHGPKRGREASPVPGPCGRSHTESGVYERVRPESEVNVGCGGCFLISRSRLSASYANLDESRLLDQTWPAETGPFPSFASNVLIGRSSAVVAADIGNSE